MNAEDTATVVVRLASGATCVVELSYASRLEEDLFPQTLVHLEGWGGSASLGAGYELTVVSKDGVERQDAAADRRSWMEEDREAIQSSVMAIQQHWATCLREGHDPETSGRDNLRTLELVFGAWESAETGEVYRVEGT